MTLPLQVAFLTGQSDPTRCALSPEQRAFIDALPVDVDARVRMNFPYDAATAPYRDVSTLAASWHNAQQYRRSHAAGFAMAHRDAVSSLISHADTTIVLAGSCGLELLANLSLPARDLNRLHVFAYGPFARRAPACEVIVVQGRRDWVSRRWRGRVDHVVDCNHLNYLRNPQVLELCTAFVLCVSARVQ